MTDTLETRRAEIEDKLAALRMTPDPEVAELIRKADAAVNAFKSQTATLDAQLAEIDGQLSIRERDRRAAAERERQERWEAQRKQLIEQEDARLQAIADAEAATRTLVDAINRTLATNARMAKIAQELSTNGKVPMSLNANDLVSRIGGRIAGLMATVKGHRNRLGAIEWQGGSLYPPDRNWRQDEEKFMAAQLLQPLLEQGKA